MKYKNAKVVADLIERINKIGKVISSIKDSVSVGFMGLNVCSRNILLIKPSTAINTLQKRSRSLRKILS